MKILYHLNKQEFKVLCKIAYKSKMDCWFYLNGEDDFLPEGKVWHQHTGNYVIDLENNNKKIPLDEAVLQMAEGLHHDSLVEWLTAKEHDLFINILQQLKIDEYYIDFLKRRIVK